ncbi:MAG: radical SAM protein [Candidatus Nezhaarchaeota archaeon]|nr:radical SAM protein [Candidatus Nezhaarchaeota archaeon]
MATQLRYALRILASYLSYKLMAPKPSFVVYCCTAKCNLRCVFCDWWKRSTPELDTDEALRLIDALCDFGVSTIDFSGGEPLLRRDLELLAARARDRGVFTVLSTNGTLVTPDRARSLSKAFNMVNVSLDGFEETHDSTRGFKGTFRRALRTINLLRNAGARVGVDLTVYGGNVREVAKLFRWLMGRVDFVSFQPVLPYPPRRGEVSLEDVEALVDELLRLKRLKPSYVAPTTWYIKALKSYFASSLPRICDAGNLYFMVDPDGSVYACNSVRGSFMGNAVKQGLKDIWNSRLRLEAARETSRCRGCLSQCTTAVSIAYRLMFSLEDVVGLLGLAAK